MSSQGFDSIDWGVPTRLATAVQMRPSAKRKTQGLHLVDLASTGVVKLFVNSHALNSKNSKSLSINERWWALQICCVASISTPMCRENMIQTIFVCRMETSHLPPMGFSGPCSGEGAAKSSRAGAARTWSDQLIEWGPQPAKRAERSGPQQPCENK